MLNKAVLLSGNGKKLIPFSISDARPTPVGWANTNQPFVAEEGMTWREWVASKYYYVPNGEVDSVFFKNSYDAGGAEATHVTVPNTRKGLLYSARSTEHVSPDDVIEGDWFNFDTFYTAYYYLCYLKDTLITLADGSTKPTQDLTYDDELLVWDFDNSCFASAKPLWIKKAQKTEHYYRLKFDDGSEIGLVGEDGKCHRLFNIEKQEFISGTDFRVGEHTFNAEGKQVKLIGIEIVDAEVEYYNVITDYHMNCFANGLLTSTQYNNVYPITDMKFVKGEREIIPFEAYEGIPKKIYDGMRLGEQDLGVRSIEKTNAYIGRMIRLMR